MTQIEQPEKKKFDLKELMFDLRKFSWYIVTEPFRIIKTGFLIVREKISSLQKIKAWMFIFGILTLLSIMAKNSLAAEVFALLFLLTALHHEWERGYFRKRWKDKEKIRAMKLMKRMEAKNDGHGNSVAIHTGEPGNNSRSDSATMDNLPDSEKNKEKH